MHLEPRGEVRAVDEVLIRKKIMACKALVVNKIN